MVFYFSATENTSNSMVFCCFAKLCRESRPFLIQFYVANHAVLVAHFNPKKVVGDTNFFLRGLDYPCISIPLIITLLPPLCDNHLLRVRPLIATDSALVCATSPAPVQLISFSPGCCPVDIREMTNGFISPPGRFYRFTIACWDLALAFRPN